MRLEGWESRLNAIIEEARERPYCLGEHDCFRVACRVIEALTGADRWPEFAGRYRSEREAFALMAQYGKSFEAAFDWFFGAPSVNVRLAQRGDICAYQDKKGGPKHLGVCLGALTAVTSARGVLFVQTLECERAWRVG